MRYSPEKAQPYLFHLIKQLFKSMLLMAGILMLGRFFFIGQFTELVVLKKNLALTFEALFLGLRYDLIPITYIVAIPYLVTCVGFAIPREGFLRFLAYFHRVWIFIFLFLLVTIMVCDLSFYSFWQEHINVLFFGLWEDDTKAVLTSIHKNYNLALWIPLILLTLAAVWWLLGRWFKRERIDLFYAQPMSHEELGLVLTAGIIVLAFLGRGNFTRLPLSIEDAHISDIEAINELSVNGVIALNRAARIRREFGKDEVRYLAQQNYQQISTAISDIKTFREEPTPPEGWHGLNDLVKTTPENPALLENPPHVVVFVMESFGSMWWPWEKELPFLDSFRAHTQEDYLFLNFLSSENGTIGSVVSLATNLPLRPGARFLSEGQYMRTKLASGAHLPYQKAGYHTRFLYGGKLGWRQLGSYLQGQGWDQLEGADQLIQKMNLYDVKEAERGNEWGVFDEYLFRYVADELKKATKPQFFFVLTTSNHPPYETPPSYRVEGLKKIPTDLKKLFSKSEEESLQRLRTLQYANRQLGNFLTTVKTGELKDKVAVAATGDHSFWIGRDEGKPGYARKYAVPFYLYLPTALKPASWDQQKWGSHIDIMPTLYERTLSKASYWGFGQDMFAPTGAALNTTAGAVGKSGAWIGNEAYCWVEGESNTLKTCPSDTNHLLLRNFRRAQIGLTDEFLRANASGMIGPLP
jgi:hypothetical protein